MDSNYLDSISFLEFEKFAITVLEYEARALRKQIIFDRKANDFINLNYLGPLNRGFYFLMQSHQKAYMMINLHFSLLSFLEVKTKKPIYKSYN